ncbi:hypothetical protein [Streptosporangium sp. NPDC006007]
MGDHSGKPEPPLQPFTVPGKTKPESDSGKDSGKHEKPKSK